MVERRAGRPCRLVLVAVLMACAGIAWAAPASAQSTPRAAMLEQQGWQAIQAGRFTEAAGAFRQALVDDDRNATAHLGAGLAAYLLQHLQEAHAQLQRALELNPRLVTAYQLLGDVTDRQGDLQGAIDIYEKGLAIAPGNAGLQAGLARLQRESALQARQRQALSNHFTVRFEGRAEQPLADEALRILEQAYWRIGTILDVYPSTPITVVLYTEQQFRDITLSPAWAAGAFDGQIRVPMRGALKRPQELARVLSHEFVHALIYTLAPSGVPMWLNEGLAVAFEDGGGAWTTPLLAKTPARIPLDDLTQSFAGLPAGAVPLAYAESAAAAEQMITLAGGIGIANLLRDLGAGVDFQKAFAQRMNMSYARFQAEYITGSGSAPGR